MSVSTSLYKTEIFESLSYYVGAFEQRDSSTNEEDFYLSNQCFEQSYFDIDSNDLFLNRYEDEHFSSKHIEDSALDSHKDEFTDNHEENNWKDYLSMELRTALQKLDYISSDVILNRWLTNDKKSLSELSEKYSLSIEHIHQIEMSTLKTLRNLLGHIPMPSAA